MKLILVKSCQECPKQYWNKQLNLPFCSLLEKDCQGGQGVPLRDCPLHNFNSNTYNEYKYMQ